MLAFCLIGTLPLNWFFHLGVLGQVRRLVLSIAPVFVVFVLWDLAATRAGHWEFDPEQTLPVRLWGLPLEGSGSSSSSRCWAADLRGGGRRDGATAGPARPGAS